MDTKVQRFVEQFGVNLYDKWQKSGEKKVFWKQDSVLRDFLEEAAAKLPQNEFRGALTRDLTVNVRKLQHFLQAHHQDQDESEPTSENRSITNKEIPLLNELQVEQALAQAHSDPQLLRKVYQALGHDDFGLILAGKDQQHQDDQVVDTTQKLLDALQWLWMRDLEQQVELKRRKTGFFLAQLTQQMGLLLNPAASSRQHKGRKLQEAPLLKLEPQQLSALCARLQQVLNLLNQLVQQQNSHDPESDKAKHSGIFYELPEGSLLAEVDFEAELARFCGSVIVLMTLSASCDNESKQVESDSESDSDSSNDSDSDSNSDTEKASAKANRHKKLPRPQSFALMAEKAFSHVFALNHYVMAIESELPWLLQVISFSLTLLKASASASSCCCQLYRELLKRGFSNCGTMNSSNTKRLMLLMICIRLATDFLAEKRQQLAVLGPVEQVTNAYATCSAIEVPTALLRWLKKTEESTEGSIWNKLQQVRRQKKSVLCREFFQKSTLTTEELQQLVPEFLKSEAEEATSMWTRDNTGDHKKVQEEEAEDDAENEAGGGAEKVSSSLFFMDAVGANSSRKRKSSAGDDVNADTETEDVQEDNAGEADEQEAAENPSPKRQRPNA